jgi:hypothetical protein
MKLIILDFLRRWFGAYLLAVLFVAAVSATMDLEGGFTFVGVLMLPFAFELGRSPVGVMATLPVSRRTIALSYWCVAVLLPVVLMAGIVALDTLLFRSFAVSSKSAVMVLVGSLAFAGSAFCLFTFISQDDSEGNPGNFLVICLWALWFLSTMWGIVHQKFLDVTTNSPVVYLTGLIGLLLTVWGYSRCEKLLFGRARKRPDGDQYPAQAPKRMPDHKPGIARFKGVLFDVLWRSFLVVLFVSAFSLIFKIHYGEDHMFWPILFAFGGVGVAGLLSGGMRLLRSLPQSAGQLALILLLMPILSILAIIAGVAIIQWINPGQFPSHYSASLMIPMAGAVCIASSLIVPFGRDGNLLGFVLALTASLVICDTIPNLQWPAAFWWLLGFSLMLAAFFLNRHWLRSSYAYRPSTGDFLRRQR